MLLGIPMETIHLILVGAFGASIAHAAQRRDPAWMLALGIPLLLCADRAGLPPTLVAWGCALYAAGGIAFLCAMLLRATGVATGAALLAAAAVLGLSAGAANARYVDLASSSLHHPPLVGIRLAAWLNLVAIP